MCLGHLHLLVFCRCCCFLERFSACIFFLLWASFFLLRFWKPLLFSIGLLFVLIRYTTREPLPLAHIWRYFSLIFILHCECHNGLSIDISCIVYTMSPESRVRRRPKSNEFVPPCPTGPLPATRKQSNPTRPATVRFPVRSERFGRAAEIRSELFWIFGAVSKW